MSRRIRALLMTALLVPGLGQLYLGRTARGIALIALTNLLLLLALVVLLKGTAPAVAARFASGAVSPADIMAGLAGVAWYGRALLAAFALVWAVAMADILVRGDGDSGQR
jgi:hypothetical protein